MLMVEGGNMVLLELYLCGNRRKKMVDELHILVELRSFTVFIQV